MAATPVPRDLRPDIWASLAIPWAAALISIGMRISARRLTKLSWWFDDYFAVVAFILATGYSGIMVQWTLHTYLGQYLPAGLSPDEREAIFQQSRYLSFFNSLCYAGSLSFSKLAILCLYWRLFKTSPIRIPILILLSVVMAWFLIRTFMLTFRCIPVQSLWDYSITDKVCHINSSQFFLATIATHFALDIVILILPLFEVFRLRMRLAQKFAVAGLFLLGTIVCMASAVVLAILVTPSPYEAEPTYDYAMFCAWGSVEVNIAIVSACFPLLRPVFALVFPKGVFSSYGQGKSSYQVSGMVSRVGRRGARSTFTGKSRGATRLDTNDGGDDDGSSTHQLADLNHSKSFETMDRQASDRGAHDGRSEGGVVRTVIRSNRYDGHLDDDTPGVMISNSTVVEVVYNRGDSGV